MSNEFLSDHRQVCMRVNVKKNIRFRRGGQDRERRVPGIRRERLKEREVKEEYERRTEDLMREGEGEERGWKEMTGVMVTAAKEVCRVTRREVANPWTIGKEEKIDRRKERFR